MQGNTVQGQAQLSCLCTCSPLPARCSIASFALSYNLESSIQPAHALPCCCLTACSLLQLRRLVLPLAQAHAQALLVLMLVPAQQVGLRGMIASGRGHALSDLLVHSCLQNEPGCMPSHCVLFRCTLRPFRPQVLTSAGLCPCCSMYPAQSNI